MKVIDIQKQDRGLLSDFFESPEYKALRKVMADWQLELAQSAVTAPTMERLSEIRGHVNAFRELDDLLKENHKQHLRKSAPLS